MLIKNSPNVSIAAEEEIWREGYCKCWANQSAELQWRRGQLIKAGRTEEAGWSHRFLFKSQHKDIIKEINLFLNSWFNGCFCVEKINLEKVKNKWEIMKIINDKTIIKLLKLYDIMFYNDYIIIIIYI